MTTPPNTTLKQIANQSLKHLLALITIILCISVIDLFIAAIRKEVYYHPLLHFMVISASLLLYSLFTEYGTDGKYNLIAGPSDSMLVLTYTFISLYLLSALLIKPGRGPKFSLSSRLPVNY